MRDTIVGICSSQTASTEMGRGFVASIACMFLGIHLQKRMQNYEKKLGNNVCFHLKNLLHSEVLIIYASLFGWFIMFEKIY